MSAFSAIEQGMDLREHARALLSTHHAVLGGARPRNRPRDLVARSWSRVLALGLDPDGRNTRRPALPGETERLRHESPLAMVIDELKSLMSSVAEASQFLLVVTNGDGVILWVQGAARTKMLADSLGFVEGALWTESAVGTNAIGTALAEAAPVQLFSAEHFEAPQHPWYCTAAPVHDPRTGELLGIVDVSGPALTLHPMIIALVESAVRLAELRLWRNHQDRLDQLRAAAAPVLANAAAPLLLVDEHGWIAHSAGIATGKRIAVPRADQPIAVPGLGLCLAEAVGDGWLVRPHGGETTVRIALDLSGPPMVEALGGGVPWRSALTARHAEILLLLHLAGRSGLSAARLSAQLYGDTEHVVTVRAEVSRLRKILGAVIDTKPYQIADGAELLVDFGPAERLGDCAFIRGSKAPGIRALANRLVDAQPS